MDLCFSALPRDEAHLGHQVVSHWTASELSNLNTDLSTCLKGSYWLESVKGSLSSGAEDLKACAWATSQSGQDQC